MNFRLDSVYKNLMGSDPIASERQQKVAGSVMVSATSKIHIYFMPSRTRPMTFPRIWQSGTMIGSMVSFSGWRRI